MGIVPGAQTGDAPAVKEEGAGKDALSLLAVLPRGKLKMVPEWWYTETVCCFNKAAWMWWSNLVCMIFHFALAITTIAASTQDGRSFASPTLTVYVTNLTWVPNATNALIPAFQKADAGLYLSTMTMMFFLLSAFAHGLIVVFNFRGAFAAKDTSMRSVGWTNWYFVWLHQCRQPLRYARHH